MTTPESQATAEARADLYRTLEQLRERLDYAKRIDNSVSRTTQRLRTQQAERPLAFAAGVTGVAVIAGLAAWSIAKAVVRALD